MRIRSAPVFGAVAGEPGRLRGGMQGVPTEILKVQGPRALFELGESRDENLVKGLQEKIDGMQGHAVVVLHMMGSHGPAYYKRYPSEFERFQPACKESQFSRCQRSEIVNSYDNTSSSTPTTSLLRSSNCWRRMTAAGVPSAMIYLSDHGEIAW